MSLSPIYCSKGYISSKPIVTSKVFVASDVLDTKPDLHKLISNSSQELNSFETVIVIKSGIMC